MRILFIITLSELGGAQSVVVNLANELAKSPENTIMIVAGNGDGKIFDLLSPQILTKKIASLLRNISPINELKTIYEFRKIYKQFKPDIIHLHSSKAGLLGRMVFPKSKIVYTVHGFDSIRVAHRIFLPLEKLLQFRSSAIVAVSKYDYEHLLSEGIRQNVTYIYNGVPEVEQEKTFEDVPYKMKVLSIARLASPKRFDLFVDVAKRFPDIGFIWIGNQETPQQELPANLFMRGNIPNANRYIASSDIFMLLSDFEGLPMVLIESLAAGTPIIASDVGGVSEIIDNHVGKVVSNNVENIATALRFLLYSENLTQMRIFSLKKYQELFTVKKMTAKYQQIFHHIYNRTL